MEDKKNRNIIPEGEIPEEYKNEEIKPVSLSDWARNINDKMKIKTKEVV